MTPPHIVVVGSINMDLVARMSRLPRPGETVSGSDFLTIPGGKGANQAVAAARLGAHVTMIGKVGDDAFGQLMIRSLQGYGVNTEHVVQTEGSSGVALIGVEQSGANSIVVVPGANGRLSVDDVRTRADVIASADALVVQLETPLETIAAAIEVATKGGVRTILDPAPVSSPQLPKSVVTVNVISPNQTEAELLTGIAVNDFASAERAARMLQQNGAREVVLKLGEMGSLVLTADGQVHHIAAKSVTVIDTTAAGDAFTAGLAVSLSEGHSLADAARFGGAAGTLACTVFGAQPAMPSRDTVEQFLT